MNHITHPRDQVNTLLERRAKAAAKSAEMRAALTSALAAFPAKAPPHSPQVAWAKAQFQEALAAIDKVPVAADLSAELAAVDAALANEAACGGAIEAATTVAAVVEARAARELASRAVLAALQALQAADKASAIPSAQAAHPVCYGHAKSLQLSHVTQALCDLVVRESEPGMNLKHSGKAEDYAKARVDLLEDQSLAPWLILHELPFAGEIPRRAYAHCWDVAQRRAANRLIQHPPDVARKLRRAS